MAMLQANTEGGWVEGLPAGIQAITVFRGIPYAAPPIGALRWKAPQRVEPWEGVKPCYHFPPIALQEDSAEKNYAKNPEEQRRNGFFPKVILPVEEGPFRRPATEFQSPEKLQSEDCLYLNIWTPAETVDETLPVAIYIHGGGHFKGYSYKDAYDGEGFAKRGVILVTVSYRLNVFGYLAHPDLSAEGPNGTSSNYGLLDLIAAISWVKRNIQNFGGDPDRITIFGQSGGAASVLSMVCTPLTKGLFQRAIMQSGGGLRKPYSPWSCSMETAESLGIRFFEYMGYTDVEEARRASAEEILKGFLRFNKIPLRDDDPLSMDGRNYMRFSPVVDGYVLPEDAISTALHGNHPELDYLLSSTSGEGDIQTIQNLAWAENECGLGRKPNYLLYFNYVPPGAANAYHSVEHPYVFQTLFRSPMQYRGFDYELSEIMANYWANFIKTGDPNGEALPLWTPYTEQSPLALEIAREVRMIRIPQSEQMRRQKLALQNHEVTY